MAVGWCWYSLCRASCVRVTERGVFHSLPRQQRLRSCSERESREKQSTASISSSRGVENCEKMVCVRAQKRLKLMLMMRCDDDGVMMMLMAMMMTEQCVLAMMFGNDFNEPGKSVRVAGASLVVIVLTNTRTHTRSIT